MSEKLDMKSINISEENVKKIQQVFPNCVTEVKENGEVKLAVDFDALKEELTGNIITDKQERYQFTWPEKAKAKQNAVSPISKTLRPVKEDETVPTGEDSNGKPYCSTGSVDFDTTQNLYIEGDNLDVLKLLQETYLGRVKMIYIDPPYNTGNDFVYNDDFAQDANEYLGNSGQYDEHGNRLFQNTESNGRFHTDWLNMIYPRLKLARDLLDKDGAIFISIDDCEQNNLQKACNDIFGADNFLVNICLNRTSEIATNFTVSKHEYLLVYAKNISDFKLQTKEKFTISRGTVGNINQSMPIIEFPAGLACYNLADGTYNETRKVDGSLENIENLDPIIIENGVLKYPVRLKARWRSSNDMRNFFANSCNPTKAKINGELVEIYFENDRFNPQLKKKTYEKISSLYLDNKRGSEDLKKLNLDGYFDFPKSIQLVKYVLEFSEKNDIILDFFSGSATTAHAVMQLNAEDGGNRKFIMVQLPEPCDEKSEAYKAGYKNICEIGKERIRRAGKKIKAENGEKAQNLDIGFRVLKLDSSNMQPVYYNPHAITQSLLDSTIDNVKTDRTPVDLLFQVMLDLGVLLSAKIEEKQVNGKHYYVVNGNDLIACFDDNIDNSVIIEIAKQKPLYAVFKDKSFATDSVGINNEQLFKTYSPATIVKVI